ncbi:type VII toxin-antitoxin system MntA family adenylyltransferase antitoxin [Pyrococcus abyssi]|uniref:Nucleotidyltransferase n=1 Tax=Pyrococcus abyssi (strain GE5 / Orsay) TaxID=272844 RepID=Q9V2Q5_PYRAB|nr:nucleotidyltransferase domain-containing protein [Pyrococcus abyssi]CAB48943.1 Nucleotidyltransferase [Pyrococcus abyssi GE5]CCE69388.1 TPA: Nucleotidyltransferase [Pyrococcus abyssi GE5]
MKRCEIEEKLKKILEKHREVIFAYLHGSILETDYFRDIDVAVYVDESVKNYLKYEISLAVELEKEISMEVDVRVLNDAPPAFRYRAIKGKLLVSRDEKKRLNFVERTVEEYLDFEPIERIMRKELLAD